MIQFMHAWKIIFFSQQIFHTFVTCIKQKYYLLEQVSQPQNIEVEMPEKQKKKT